MVGMAGPCLLMPGNSAAKIQALMTWGIDGWGLESGRVFAQFW